MNTEFYTIMDNDLYLDFTISNEELVTYMLLQKNYNKAKGISLCSINMLLDFMYVRHNNRIAQDIRNSINSLIDKEYVTNIYDLHFQPIAFEDVDNKDLFYIELLIPENNYFKIYDYHTDKIFSYIKTTNIDKFNFVRYFIATQRVISNSSGFGYLTQTTVKKLCGESKTVSNYNRILQEDLHIIRYCSDYITEKKQYCSTYIGRYEDVNNFEMLLKAEVESKGLVHSDKKKSNEKRSKKQLINKTEKKIIESDKDAEIKRLQEELETLKKQRSDLEFKPPVESNAKESKVIQFGQSKKSFSFEMYYSDPNNAQERDFKIEEIETRIEWGEDPEEFNDEDKFIYEKYCSVTQLEFDELIENL